MAIYDKLFPPSSQLGGIESEASMTLHTRLAVRLWEGHQGIEQQGVYAVVGVPRFARQIAQIWTESALDNPVADWVLVTLEERFEIAERMIDENLATIRNIIDDKTVFDTVSEAASKKPFNVELRFHNPWSYRVTTLIKKYDDIVRMALTAKHIGIFSDEDWKQLVKIPATKFRAVTGVVLLDPGIHLERSWFKERSDLDLRRARRKLNKLGRKLPFMPKEILEGTRRPKMAPAIIPPEETKKREALLEQSSRLEELVRDRVREKRIRARHGKYMDYLAKCTPAAPTDEVEHD